MLARTEQVPRHAAAADKEIFVSNFSSSLASALALLALLTRVCDCPTETRCLISHSRRDLDNIESKAECVGSPRRRVKSKEEEEEFANCMAPPLHVSLSSSSSFVPTFTWSFDDWTRR